MIRRAGRCASGAGRRERESGPGQAELSGADLTVTGDEIAISRELFEPDRAARMDATGGDADLRAEAKLAAVTELGRGVPHRNRAIDSAEESFGDARVFRDDRVRVLASVSRYVGE